MPSVYIGVGFTTSYNSFEAQKKRLGCEAKHTKEPGTDIVSTRTGRIEVILQKLCDEFSLPELSTVWSVKKYHVAFLQKILVETTKGDILPLAQVRDTWIPALSVNDNFERLRLSFDNASDIGLVLVHGEYIDTNSGQKKKFTSDDGAARRGHRVGRKEQATGALGPCPVDRSADLSLS